MNKKLTLALSILSFTMLDAIFPVTNESAQKPPKDPYNCEDLTKKFDYLAGNKEELDNTLNALMERKSEIKKPHLNNQIAALICFGAKPNWKHKFYQENLLDYGIESGDAQFVSFLLKRKVTIIQNCPIQFKVRSLAMLQALTPYVHIDIEAPRSKDNKNTIAHQLVTYPSFDADSKGNFDADLLDYYVKNSDIANVYNNNRELPLHTLAHNCNLYDFSFYQSPISKKAKTLINKTRNINALDKKGRTPLDLALKSRKSKDSFDSCKILIDMLIIAGGKATSTNNF